MPSASRTSTCSPTSRRAGRRGVATCRRSSTSARSRSLLMGLARPTMVVATPREDATVILDHGRVGLDAGDRRRSPTRLDAARSPPRCLHRPAARDGTRSASSLRLRPVTLVAPTDRPRGRSRPRSKPRGRGRDRDGRRADAGARHRRDRSRPKTPTRPMPRRHQSQRPPGRIGATGRRRRHPTRRVRQSDPAVEPAARRGDPPVGRSQLRGPGRADRCRAAGRDPRRAHLHDRARDRGRRGAGPATSSGSR